MTDREVDEQETVEDELPEDWELPDDTAEDEEYEELPPGEDRSAPVVAPTPGCAVSFYVDNKLRHGICLAAIGDELLLEHKRGERCYLFTGKVQEIVPRLRCGVASATIIVGSLKSCRYRFVPKRWLQQMVRTGQTWKGIEGGGKLAPAPAELLKGQMELF